LKPIISVILPIYNGEEYLNEAMESILIQTFKDFELIVIDDASNDNSVEIINKYEDPRIKLHENKKNIGQASSENIGLTLSSGKYIARLDQDDVMLQDRLGIQVEYLEKNPDIAAIGCQYFCIDENGSPLDEMHWPVGFKNNLYSLITGFSPVGHPGALIRKNVLEQVGKYDPRYAPAEDYELWLRLVANGHKINNLDLFLTKHRKHRMQTSTLKKDLLRKKHTLAFKNFYHLIVGMEQSTNDLIEYFNIFKFKSKVKQNNIRKIFTIYFSLLNSINKINYLEKNIKSVLYQQFFNAIGKNIDDVSFIHIISESIRHRVLNLEVRKQLWAIYKAK